MFDVTLSLPNVHIDQIFSSADAIGLTIKHYEQIHKDRILIVFRFKDHTELLKYKALLRLIGVSSEYIEALKFGE